MPTESNKTIPNQQPVPDLQAAGELLSQSTVQRVSEAQIPEPPQPAAMVPIAAAPVVGVPPQPVAVPPPAPVLVPMVPIGTQAESTPRLVVASTPTPAPVMEPAPVAVPAPMPDIKPAQPAMVPIARRRLPAWAGPVLFFVGIFILLYSVRLGRVGGGSMEPTLHENSRIVFDTLTYHLTGIHRGDIIIFTNPHDTSVIEVKRVVGLPGELVQAQGGTISITRDGKTTEIPQGTTVGRTETGDFTMQLGPQDYYVLGDNRSHSTDSRDFGAVQPVNIIGRVFFSW